MSTTQAGPDHRRGVRRRGARLPRRQRRRRGRPSRSRWGEGSDDVALFAEKSPRRRPTKSSGPRRGATRCSTPASAGSPARASTAAASCPSPTTALYASIEGDVPDPVQSRSASASGMVAPTILAHATDEVKDLYLAEALPGRHRRLPAVQRAGRRLRPGRPADQGGARTATSGSSTARRCGPRAPTTATSARSSAAPTPTSPSTRASPASSSTCTRPASRSGRCAR